MDKELENLEDNSLLDVVIPVLKPGKRITEIVRRLRRQALKINKIYIINFVKDERYSTVNKSDGIMNFSYEDGEISFNGVQTNDSDIVNFNNLDDQTEVEVIYLPQKESSHKGIVKKVLEITKAKFVLFMSQDTMPVNGYMSASLLEPFKNEFVKVSIGRLIASKKLGYIEKTEFRLSRISDGGIIEIGDSEALSFSVFWEYNDCAVYRRETLEEFAKSELSGVSLLNEDMYILDFIINNKGLIACSDTDVKCYRVNSPEYVYSRGYELAMASKNTSVIKMRGFRLANGTGLTRTRLSRLIIRGKGYLVGKYLSYKLLASMGILAANVIPKKVVDSVVNLFIKEKSY